MRSSKTSACALLAVVILAGCSAHDHAEPLDRGWIQGWIESEAVQGSLLILSVEHRPRAKLGWCYEFESGRARGQFCAESDLGYDPGNVLALTLERMP